MRGKARGKKLKEQDENFTISAVGKNWNYRSQSLKLTH